MAEGSLQAVLMAVRSADERHATVHVFESDTARVLEVDQALRESGPETRPEETLAMRAPAADDAPRGRGRPRLGVVAKEVTLLPRHWEWLTDQPGGASVALRKLVEAAIRTHATADAVRHARDAAHRFMTVIAGDRPGYEDAVRALYAGDRVGFLSRVAAWPADIRERAARLAAPSWETDA